MGSEDVPRFEGIETRGLRYLLRRRSFGPKMCPALRGLRLPLRPRRSKLLLLSEDVPRFEGIETIQGDTFQDFYDKSEDVPRFEGIETYLLSQAGVFSLLSEDVPRFEGIETSLKT